MTQTTINPASINGFEFNQPITDKSQQENSVLLKNLPGKFISALAYEVRNPLANINLSVEVLKSAIKEKDLNLYLEIIQRNSTRVHNLINVLLKYYEVLETKSDQHSIYQLLDNVLEMVEDRIKLKNIKVIKTFAGEDFKTLMNEEEMKIALTNIVLNSIESMDAENGQLKLITKSTGDQFEIQIEDNGCGISKSNLKNIFKPYFSNKPGGIGLGLATTHDILQSNHVMVNVESEQGRGTIFVLTFDKTRNIVG
jgi:signal transduction histidine kinase